MKKEILEVLKTIAAHEDSDRDQKDENSNIIGYLSAHLRSLTEEQFICLFPFLSQRIDELKLDGRDYYVFSSEQRTKLRRAKFTFVWQIFCEDWRSYHDRTIDGEAIIGCFTQLIEVPFNFRICFTHNQKQRLPI